MGVVSQPIRSSENAPRVPFTVRVDLDAERRRVQTFYDEPWAEIRRYGSQIAVLFGTDITVTYSGVDAQTGRFRSEVFGHFCHADGGTFAPAPDFDPGR